MFYKYSMKDTYLNIFYDIALMKLTITIIDTYTHFDIHDNDIIKLE